MVQFEYLKKELAEIKNASQYRQLREIQSAQSATAIIENREYTLFCSNNYLSLANDPRIIETAQKALKKYGYGAAASRLISGTMSPHVALEREFADFFEKESSLLFTSGWCANQAILTTIPQKGDLLLLDKIDHASIIDAAKASPASFRTYRRDNLDRLEKHLASPDYKNKLIITESVFSMDGDCAPLKELVNLKNKYNACLIVDEAHSAGCLGDQGKGFCKDEGILGEVDIIVATLSKAFGASGGIVAGPSVVKEYLINKARGLIYTTAPSPVNCCVISKALELIKEDDFRREKLNENSDYLRHKLADLGFNTGTSQTYVIPVIIGNDSKTVEISQKLFERGFYVPAIRPPTVAPGTSRLRISVQADHTKEQLDALCSNLAEVFRQ